MNGHLLTVETGIENETYILHYFLILIVLYIINIILYNMHVGVF